MKRIGIIRLVVIATLAAIFFVFPIPNYLLDMESCWLVRATSHSFFHANILHLGVNCYSLWYILSPKHKDNIIVLIIGFAIATLSYLAAIKPTIGMSNVICAVVGLRAPSFRSTWWRSIGVLFFFAGLIIGGLLPNISATTHIVAFILGLLFHRAELSFQSLMYDLRRTNNYR